MYVRELHTCTLPLVLCRQTYKVDFQTPLKATGDQGFTVEFSSFTLQLPVGGGLREKGEGEKEREGRRERERLNMGIHDLYMTAQCTPQPGLELGDTL